MLGPWFLIRLLISITLRLKIIYICLPQSQIFWLSRQMCLRYIPQWVWCTVLVKISVINTRCWQKNVSPSRNWESKEEHQEILCRCKEKKIHCKEWMNSMIRKSSQVRIKRMYWVWPLGSHSLIALLSSLIIS